MVSELDRLQELEMRVNALERKVRALEHGPLGIRGLLERVVPRDVREHFGAARREYFLAWRAYLDRMIGRPEEAEEPRRGNSRRRIKVL